MSAKSTQNLFNINKHNKFPEFKTNHINSKFKIKQKKTTPRPQKQMVAIFSSASDHPHAVGVPSANQRAVF